MNDSIKRLRSVARLWKLRVQLPSWHQLSRSPRLTNAQVIQGKPGFYPFTSKENSTPAIPLSPVPDFLSPTERAWGEMPPKPIPELGCFVLRNTLCGGEGYLFHKNRMGRDPMTVPREWQRRLWMEPMEGPPNPQVRPRLWPRPLISFLSRDYRSYGHWWLDTLPRLFHLKKHYPTCFDQCDLAIADNLPAWALDSLQKLIGVPPDHFVSYNPKSSEYLLPPWIVVPTMAHQSHHFHPAASEFYDHAMQWAQSHATSPLGHAPRLFLTRGPNQPYRPLENRKEIEHAFVQAGYQMVAPEKFSWAEQIALFAQADIVAGEHGSAMKNMVFARPNTVQIVINHLNNNQATIAALRKQPCLIHRGIGFSVEHRLRPYRADLSAIQKSINWAENYRTHITS